MKGTTNSQRGTGGGGEKLVISLKTNQASHEDLIGAKFSVVISGSATEYTWQGQSITVNIPPMMSYTVEFGDVEGYAKPEPITHTAVDGNDRFVTGIYNTELVTVNVSADNGTVSGYEVTIAKVNTYGDNKEYTEVEYIEATGSQYIDTGFVPNQDTRVVVKMEDVVVSGVNDFYFGTRTSATSNAFFFSYSSDGSYRSGYNETNSAVSSSYTQSGVFTVDKNKGVTYINGTQVSSVTYASFTCPANLVIGGINTKGTISYATAKYYACQIYDNGTLIRDYVPVVNKSGIAGLYDKVNNAFYSSASSTAFVAGNIVSEVIITQTNSSASYKIPYGISYLVSASETITHVTPDKQIFTASQISRIVSVKYGTIPYGVYIQGVSGKLYTSDEWDNQETVNGIAVLASKCRFVIANNHHVGKMYYGGDRVQIAGVTTTSDISVAKTDYDGEAQTTKIINALKGVNDGYVTGAAAAEYCRNYTFPNGKKGYMGAAGEWQTVIDNLSAINSVISLVGGLGMSSPYWTSTLCDNTNPGDRAWYKSAGNQLATYLRGNNTIATARPFCSI